MGNEISGRQKEVSKKYDIPLDQLQKWYHENYINFLKQEISDKTWETKYQKEMKYKDGQTIHILHDKFCKWKDIQREIFEATLDNHRFLLYTWEERAKKFIDKAEMDNNFSGIECDKYNKTNKENVDEDSSSSSSPPGSSGLTIDLSICLPKRRDIINTRLRNIQKQINDIQDQKDGSDHVKAKIAASNIIGTLAIQTEKEIDNLLNHYPNNTQLICKLIGRTYADYKDISKGKDIIKHDVSQNVQNLLKNIVDKIGGETQMEDLWETHFKKTVEQKLKKLKIYENKSNNQKFCTLDHSELQTPQCLRYMQEWFENFVEQKDYIAKSVEGICTGKIILPNVPVTSTPVLCSQYCNIYKDFLGNGKKCYEKFKTQCEKNLKSDSIYSDDGAYNAHVQSLERQIKEKSGCGNKCENNGNVDLIPLFELKNSSTNKSYFCYCNGPENKGKAPCKDEKIKKSTVSLAGNWQTAAKDASKRSGANASSAVKPKEPCELDYKVFGIGGGGSGADPCSGVWDTTIWKCDSRDVREEGICLPPRRQEICLSNIKNLRDNDISGMDSNKLLLELMLAAKQQAWRVHNNYKNKNRQLYQRGTNACETIKLNFLDFGDIIKGTDKANDNNSVDVERNMKAIFENLRNDWKNSGNPDNTKYDDSGSYGLSQLRSDWWEENKKYIWDAFNCGNSCNMPQDDRSQFLRWLDEWATEFCHQKTWMQQSVTKACKFCGDDVCASTWTSWWTSLFSPMDKFCDCKNQCKSYSTWIQSQKTLFDTQAKYYDQNLTLLDFGNNSGVTTTRGKSTTSSSVPNVAKYLKQQVKNCGNNVDFNDVPKTFSSYPDETSKYRHKCSRCYAQLEADLTYKEGTTINVCGVNKILTKDKGRHITHFCNDKNLVNTVRKDNNTEWNEKNVSKTYSVSSGGNVGVPPRYDDICKDTIKHDSTSISRYTDKHDYYYNNRMLLSELILVAQHEGKTLRKHYKNSGGISSGQNYKSCEDMRRSFADIGDIVKGTSIIYNENDDVEKHLKEMFTKLRYEYYSFGEDRNIYGYSGDEKGLRLFRKNWWERNRHMIWEAFKCGDPDTQKCINHMDMDKVPQVLRWITEWSEKFCKAQKEQFVKLKNACDACTKGECNGKKNTSSCQKCTEACIKYSNFVNKWKEQWERYERMYTELYTSSVAKSETTTDDNALYIRKLIRENKLSSLSPSAATYVHSTMKNNDCAEQHDFGNINDDKYAFKEIPNGYDTACKCGEDTPQSDSPSSGSDSNGTYSTETKTNLCESTLKDIHYEQWDCNQKDENDNQVCKKKKNDKNYSGSDDIEELMSQWVQSFLKEYEAFKIKVKECTNKANRKLNTSPTTCSKEDCPNKCYCYKKWIINRKYEWGKQKEYFKKHNNENNANSAVGILGSLENLDILEVYLKAKFHHDLKKALSDSGSSYQEQYELSEKTDPVTQILMKSENLINECENICPKKLDCDDKGFTNDWNCDNGKPKNGVVKDMCVRKDYTKTSNVSNDDEFFFVFNDWLEEISQNMRHHINMLEETCDNKIIGKKKKDNPNICNECKTNCECYGTWKKDIDNQWTKQKENYKTYKANKSEMQNIDLNTYLEALCETMTDKNGYVQEDECTLKDTQSSNNDIFREKLKSLDSNIENICASCPDDDTKKKDSAGDNCNDIKKFNPSGSCKEKEYDTEGTNKKKWECKDFKDSSNTGNSYCLPPRRQQLCISYLAKNYINGEEDLKNYLYRSIKDETKQLLSYYQTKNPVTGNGNSQKNDENNLPTGFCKSVERSFADIGNIVKGTNLDNSGDTPKVKEKLETLFKEKITDNRTNWWERNKRELWKAVKCGIEEANKPKSGANNGLYCPQNLDFDRRDQFLRWFEEWGNYFYKEHENKIEKIKNECGKNGQTNMCTTGTPHGTCGTKCKEYKNWIENEKKKDEWDKLEKKYNDDQNSNKYTDYDNMADMLSPTAYLNFSCMDDKCPSINYPKVMKLEDKTYKSYCVCDSPEYKNRVEGKDDSTSSDTTDPCNIPDTGFRCNKKMFGKYWSSSHVEDENGKKIYGVYRPPRRQKLCIANIIQYSTKDNLLENVLLDAQNEANLILDYYKNEHKKIIGNDDNNFPSGTACQKACRAIKRSFYDFGDIIKGTDMENAAYSNYARTRLKNTFIEVVKKEKEVSNKQQQRAQHKSTYTPSENEIKKKRQDWWNNHKSQIWEAMNCDKDKCNDTKTPTGDDVPQFLRWYEEWYEEFFTERTNLLANIQKECKKQIPQRKCDSNDIECQDACTQYSKWLAPKKLEWKNQKNKYLRDYKDAELNTNNDDEFKKATKDKTSPEKYLEHKCKNICKNIKENMDLIVEKKDSDYIEKYEPLCSRCKFTKILDKAKRKQKKQQDQKQNRATPDSGGGSHSGTPNASVDTISSGNRNPGSSGSSSSSSTPQEEPCKIAEDVLKRKNENKDGKIDGCGEKNFNNKTWNCDSQIDKTNHNGACMPPRRQSLCINNLQVLTGSNKTDDLRKAFIECTSIETYWLWEQYKKDHGNEASKLKDGKIPEDFLRTMFYTLGDFRDLCLDRDISVNDRVKNPNVIAAKNNIKQILKNESDRGTWWQQIEKDVWQGMLCTLKQAGGNDTIKTKSEYQYGSVTFEGTTTTSGVSTSGGTDLTTFASRPQFLRWLTEWYDDYCYKKNTKLEAVKTHCKKVGDTEFKCDNAECKEKCDEYEKYMKERKEQWGKQKGYYSDKRGANTTDYSGTDAKEYLKDKFTVKCGANSSGAKQPSGSNVETNITALTTSSLYYDVDEYCGCTKFIKEDEYDKISKQNNCVGLQNKAKETSGIKWINADGTNENKYLGDRGVPKEVYLPPRKKTLCFQGFDGRNNDVKTEDKLKEQLMKVSATEGYNLGQYYKNKNEKKNGAEAKKYSYDVLPCNAMKYSFLDLRDIIIGHDMTEPEKEGTEKHLKNIIFKNGGKNNNTDRKQWWTQNQKCVWDAMKCGYKKGRDEGSGNTPKPSKQDLKSCDNFPSDTEYPVASDRDSGKNYQFLRWFAEWGENFCRKQTREYNTLQQKCSGCTGGATCTGCTECQAQCKLYEEFIGRWKEQYEKQKTKFEADKTKNSYEKDKDANGSSSAREFLEKKLKKVCQNSGASGSTECNCMDQTSSQNSGKDMPQSLDEKPDIVKGKCDCTTTSQPSTAVPAGGKSSTQTPSQNKDQTGSSSGTGPPGVPPGSPGVEPDSSSGTQPGGNQGGSGPDSPGNSETNAIPSGKPSGEPHSGGSSSRGSSVSTDPSGQGNSSNSSNQSPSSPTPGGQHADPSSGGNADGNNSGGGNTATGSDTGDPDSDGGRGAGKSQPQVPLTPAFSTRGADPNNSGISMGRDNKHTKPQPPTSVDLEKCPLKNDTCNYYGNNRKYKCRPKKRDIDLNDWTKGLVKIRTGKNKGILVPPRRRHLCFNSIRKYYDRINDENTFKEYLLHAASNEAKYILELYGDKNPEKALQSIKYSFADIGNIIKGDDMLDDRAYDKIVTIFSNINNSKTDENSRIKNKEWWNKNKQLVWNVMLCRYEQTYNYDIDTQICEFPSIENDEQFLRWLTEWAKLFCDEKGQEAKRVVDECLGKINGAQSIDKVLNKYCKKTLIKYRKWYIDRKVQWNELTEHYKEYKENLSNNNIASSVTTILPSNADEYLKRKCPECDCNYQDLEEIYQQITNKNNEVSTLIKKAQSDQHIQKGKEKKSFVETLITHIPQITQMSLKATQQLVPLAIENAIKTVEKGIKNTIPFLEKIKKNHIIPTSKTEPINPPQSPETTNKNNTPSNIPVVPMNNTNPNIIVPTIGAVAATILGILLYKWRSPMRSKGHVDDMIRILEMPQNYHEIPTNKSSNRYIPYGSKYKGKTYIYVEDQDTDDDKYMFTSDTTDVTSSESEYDEMDINDIYPYKSPKYKTLIEVVLKPSSKTHDAENIYIDYIEDSSDKPTNKFTDVEWNQLKQDFISQYLQNIQKDLSNENIIDDKMYKYTQPNILDVSNEEKPFITSIQDRKLYGDSEITYNIVWNVPKNINRTTNNMNDPKYVSSNDQYTGIDLINDALNSDQHLDIYDELLKRKENELFGAKHTKYT
ncbi:erythrocyte membrane protein 1, PfEMP1, putative [Plasmodium sp. DRC-Itaito]|nr:erythrocyte membrane protein 1, PfEMP1, putative [Plasmodium sp. DRC-Itaito]